MSSCPHFDRATCRSCTQLELAQAAQLTKKSELLSRVTGVEALPALASAPTGFRDKLKLSVGGSLDHIQLGLLSPDLREVFELSQCQVNNPWFEAQFPALKALVRSARLTPYDIASRRGELKGIILSRSPQSGEAMVRFVLRSREGLDRLRLALPQLAAFKVVSANIQPIPHALLEGPEEIILTDDHFISHHTGVVQLAFAPKGFMQTNLAVADQLYLQAARWATEHGPKTCVDLFCGSGGFALHLAQLGLAVTGVEIEAQAVAMAKAMATQAALDGQFVCASADQIQSTLAATQPDLILVNPPRRGLAGGRGLLMQQRPRLIIYSSCHLQSLEADLTELKTLYDIKKTQVFDMFPHTDHFESLSLLIRR